MSDERSTRAATRQPGAASRHRKNGRRVQTSVIVPAYNEERGIGIVLERLFGTLDDSHEVIVVDDGSTDATRAIASRFPCRLVRHGRNHGKGQALRTGLGVARGTYTVVVDADDTYPVEMIPRLAGHLATHDVVSGTRTNTSLIPSINRLGNWGLREAIRRLYGSAIEDPLTGFYAARTHLLRSMRLTSTGFGIEAEIAIKAAGMGLRVINVPIVYAARQGHSKLDPLTDGYRIMRTTASFLALYNPMIAFMMPGALWFTVGLALMARLGSHAMRLGRIALSYHSMLGGATLALLGLQIMIFGLAAHLYARRHWLAAADRLGRIMLHRRTRPAMLTIGAAALLTGTAWGLRLMGSWVRSSFAPFTRTEQAIWVLFLILFGVQMLFSVAFLGLFMGSPLEEEPVTDAVIEAVPGSA